MMFTVLVVRTCLLLNATTLLILIVGVLIVTVMMLLSTAVSLCNQIQYILMHVDSLLRQFVRASIVFLLVYIINYLLLVCSVFRDFLPLV